MSRASIMPIIDAPVSALVNGWNRLLPLLWIYALPWFLGTLVLIGLDVLFREQSGSDAPEWLKTFAWAPFAAMAMIALLRLIYDGRVPPRGRPLELGIETVLATLVYIVWFGAMLLIDALRAASWASLFDEAVQTPGADLQGYAIQVRFWSFAAMAWLTKVLAFFFLFGLIVVAMKFRRLDVRKHLDLLRIAPLQTFAIMLLFCFAASQGLENLFSMIAPWTDLVGAHLPPPLLRRHFIIWKFLVELNYFPLNFLAFALEGLVLAEVYRRLLAADEGLSKPGRSGATVNA